MSVSKLSRSLLAKMSQLSAAVLDPQPVSKEEGEGQNGEPEGSYCHMKNCDIYPPRKRVVDDDCPAYVGPPFDLLSGENVEYVGCPDGDFIIISNYRFFAAQKKGFYNMPLGLIEEVELQHRKEDLVVLCKDARSFRLVFDSAHKCKVWQERLLESLRRSRQTLKSTFAFVHRAYSRDQRMERSQQGDEVEPDPATALLSLKGWVNPEYQRMGMDLDHRWRISEANSKYEVCLTYPKVFVVPRSIADEEVKLVANFRMSGRVPTVVWRHPTNGCVIVRSSQPQVGVLGIWRCPEDEKLLMAISHACAPTHHDSLPTQTVYQNGGPHVQLIEEAISNGGPGKPVQNGQVLFESDEEVEERREEEDEEKEMPKLLVMDLRSYTAALGNRAKGGGCECQEYYPNCEIQYKGLPNIHSVRSSFQQLRSVLASEDQTSFLSNLEATQWLFYLCQLLSVACEVVTALHDIARPVLVHCSDGWDRTPQVVALAELMLDPYYRTIEGFRVLVEREWLAYGHKFGDRCGHSSEDSTQRSPVFLQWLDCVHQLIRQFPCEFQFSEAFLVKLGQHCYSRLFGTFLGNSTKKREEERMGEETLPVWSLLHCDNSDFINYLYCPTGSNTVLRPVSHIKSMLLWREMYCSPVLVPYQGGDRKTSPTLLHNRMSQASNVTSRQGFHSRGQAVSTSPPAPEVADSATPTSADNGQREEEEDTGAENEHSEYCSLEKAGDSNTEQTVSIDIRNGGVNAVLDSSALDAGLLQDAIVEEPAILPATLTVSSWPACLGLGVDGLPSSSDPVHQRLHEIEQQHQNKVADLIVQLKQSQQQDQEEEGKKGGEWEQKDEPCSPEENPPSSLQSWDCVDHRDSVGVRWVPDHASHDCQGCGIAFQWVINRKHHCRSCGGVFCSKCTDFFCPVPNEQLFDDVRVCEKCFYRLDGHMLHKGHQSFLT